MIIKWTVPSAGRLGRGSVEVTLVGGQNLGLRCPLPLRVIIDIQRLLLHFSLQCKDYFDYCAKCSVAFTLQCYTLMMSVDVVLAVLVQWPGQYLSTCAVSSFALTNANYMLIINVSPAAPCPARGWAAC